MGEVDLFLSFFHLYISKINFLLLLSVDYMSRYRAPISALVTTPTTMAAWQPMILLVQTCRPSAAHTSSSIDKQSISTWYIRHLCHVPCALGLSHLKLARMLDNSVPRYASANVNPFKSIQFDHQFFIGEERK